MTFVGKEQLLGAAEAIDAQIAGLRRFSLLEPAPGRVTAFLFHRFFEDDELEEDRLGIYPHEGVTLAKFEQFLRLCRDSGFDFVTPQDVPLRTSARKAVMITVDDGYADNQRIVPLLEKYDAKAVIFISPANVASGRRFWPDALFIGAQRQRLPANERRRLLREMKLSPYPEAADRLQDLFGVDIFDTEGFLDRPLSVAELCAIAKSPRIEIGMHGYDHTILAPRSGAFVTDQLFRAAETLEEMIGYRPTCVSYPNGVYSDLLIHTCRALGLTTGMTIEARNNAVEDWRDPDRALRLGRFTFSGVRDTRRQLQSTQMPQSLMQALYRRKRTKVEDLAA